MSGRRTKLARRAIAAGRMPTGVSRRWLRRHLDSDRAWRRASNDERWAMASRAGMLPDLDPDDVPTDHDGGAR